MFRATTQLKGFAIDINSFSEAPFELSQWEKMCELYPCVFIVNKEKKDDLRSKMNEYLTSANAKILSIESNELYFGPNKAVHQQVLEVLQISTSELAYITADYQFASRALGFYSAVFWIKDNPLIYQSIPDFPDLVCKNLDDLIELLQKNILGYASEVVMQKRQVRVSMYHVILEMEITI